VRNGFLISIVASVLGAGVVHADDALLNALKSGDDAAAVAAIDRGSDVNAREPDGTSVLHWAVYDGDFDLVTRLIRAGADVKVSNDFGVTPLSQAAVTGDPRIIQALLKAGADPESPNAEGQTALMVVARTGNVESAKLLLRHGAKVNATEQWGGQTALMWAAAQSQPEMVKFLISKKANVNARAVVRDWQRRVTAEGRPKDMNHGGFTPLLYAAREGCVECAKNLIKGKADINMTDPDRTTALVLAIMNFHFDLAAYLISAGADVNKWDFFGQTPLYVAIDMNTLPRGGRPDIPSSDNTTALQVAEMLLAAGANPNIQLKLRPPYRNAVFDRGGDPILDTGATPLLRAAAGADVPAINLLLKYKAMIDLPNATGVTPLMAAAGTGRSANPTRGRFKTDSDALAAVRVLKENGAQINMRDQTGVTALHSAAQQGWDETVKVLVADGADLEAVDNKGLRPIDFAVGRYERAFLAPEPKRQETTIKLLKEYIVAATGRQPLEFAGNLSTQQRGTGQSVDR